MRLISLCLCQIDLHVWYNFLEAPPRPRSLAAKLMKIIRFREVSNSFQSLRKIPEIKFGPIVVVKSYTVTIGKVEMRGGAGRNRKMLMGERKREEEGEAIV